MASILQEGNNMVEILPTFTHSSAVPPRRDKGEGTFSNIAMHYLNVLNGEYVNWLRFEGNKSGNNILKSLHQKVLPHRYFLFKDSPIKL